MDAITEIDRCVYALAESFYFYWISMTIYGIRWTADGRVLDSEGPRREPVYPFKT